MAKKIKGYLTKYALSSGIKEVEGEPSLHDKKYIRYRVTPGFSYAALAVIGEEFFTDRDEAIADAKKRAQGRIRSLQKQIEWMKRLVADPKFEKPKRAKK